MNRGTIVVVFASEDVHRRVRTAVATVAMKTRQETVAPLRPRSLSPPILSQETHQSI